VDAVARFAELVDRPSEEVDLAQAALAFAAAADPGLDAAVWLAELDRLADGVHDFDGLHQRLFVEAGFTGAAHAHHDPDSSMLQRVLERRRGLPIALAVVAMEVGRRAGVAVQGIGAPGHFLIRDPGSGRYCDAFGGGTLLTEAEAVDLLAAMGAGWELRAHLPVVTSHEILIRMLANLVHLYRRQSRHDDLEWSLRCQRALPGMTAEAALQLGESLELRGRFPEAAAELEAAVEVVDEVDGQRLRRAARAIRARMN
jgi:hypothetical protein